MKIFLIILLIVPLTNFCQNLLTPFEKSEGKETATYFECIDFYKKLDQFSGKISIRKMGISDAGYPYDVVLFSSDGAFDPRQWHAKNKLVMLIINGIHPGEPDGVDASMLLLRDLAQGKMKMPEDVVLAVIPIYNIGGALNRNSFSRVNQQGPVSYGFRGNAQNLDLNRDFTKCDSRDAKSFAKIFHWLNPDIQLDNHVSDGADYQYTMTLISTQWNKLGGSLGKFSHDIFDPALFHSMEEHHWPMCPYVNFEEGNVEKGWEAFHDYPRYSSGYAALFHTLSFISETHMLKPFKDRVWSTYTLMQSMIDVASAKSKEIIDARKTDFANDMKENNFSIKWKVDSTLFDLVPFKGYEASYRTSEVTSQSRLYYDHSKPFEKKVVYFDYYKSDKSTTVPDAYIIPQGWHEVIELLRLNKVTMTRLVKDSVLSVAVYHIDDYKSYPKPYEKHHKNFDVNVSSSQQIIHFLKGDYIISTHQPARRFLVEMLEPIGEDSYFAWNFFDAILQQKEGYSNYRWEDVAATYLKDHPELRAAFDQKKQSDPVFDTNTDAQLNFIYKNSPYYEPAHLRYPVYRLLASR